MYTRFMLTGFLFLSLFACKEAENSTFEEDKAKLEKEYEEIVSYATSVPCTDAGDWKFAPYGAKPCGGPWGYIPYSTDINEQLLFAMLDHYHATNEKFNQKWGLGSDCAIASVPQGVVCENDKPVLVFE